MGGWAPPSQGYVSQSWLATQGPPGPICVMLLGLPEPCWTICATLSLGLPAAWALGIDSDSAEVLPWTIPASHTTQDKNQKPVFRVHGNSLPLIVRGRQKKASRHPASQIFRRGEPSCPQPETVARDLGPQKSGRVRLDQQAGAVRHNRGFPKNLRGRTSPTTA